MDNREIKLPILPSEDERREDDAIEVRSHTVLSDLGRTDSRKQGIESVELVPGTLYGSTRKQAAAILTGQTQLLFDIPKSEVKMAANTDIVLTYLLGNIRQEDLFDRSENTVARAECTLTDYMQLRGLKDRKEARKQVKEEIKTLFSTSITSEDDETFIGVPLAAGTCGIDKRGNISFVFSPLFKLSYLLSEKSYTLLLDPRAFQVNTKRNPHAWHIHKKLVNHYSANMGKPNEYRLSVSSLLDYVSSIPKPEDVPRKETERIITPMERDLNMLVELGVLDYWDYCRANGEPLTDEEQAARLDEDGNEKTLPYRIAKDALITWKFTNEYRREERLLKKDASRQRKLESKAAKEERDSRIKKQAEKIAAKKLAEKMLED